MVRMPAWRTAPNAEGVRGRLLSVGFHGDRYLIEVAEHLLAAAAAFVETGSNVGSTLRWVAQTFPAIPCLSCEPDPRAFSEATTNTGSLANVSVSNLPAQAFLQGGDVSELPRRRVVFWLDAHGFGFEWPLRDEIAIITSRFDSADVLIDDFLVPGMPMFGWDSYDGQECSYDYIRDALKPERSYRLYYPSYTERTSPHHPLRGWGLIRMDTDRPAPLPPHLRAAEAATVG